MNLHKHSLSQGENKKSFKMYKRKKQWVVAPLLLATVLQLAAAPITTIGVLGAQTVAAAVIDDGDKADFAKAKADAIAEVNAIAELSDANKKAKIAVINGVQIAADKESLAAQYTAIKTAVSDAYVAVGAQLQTDLNSAYDAKIDKLVEAGLTDAHAVVAKAAIDTQTNELSTVVAGKFTGQSLDKKSYVVALSYLTDAIDEITPALDKIVADNTKIAADDNYLKVQASLEAAKAAAKDIVENLAKEGLSTLNVNEANGAINVATDLAGIASALDIARADLAADLTAAKVAAEALAEAKEAAKTTGLSGLTFLSAAQIADYKAQIDAAKTTAAVTAVTDAATAENSRLSTLVGQKTSAKVAVDALENLSAAQKTSLKTQIEAASSNEELEVIKTKAVQADTLTLAKAANTVAKVDALKAELLSGGDWAITGDGISNADATEIETTLEAAVTAATTPAALLEAIQKAYTAVNTAADTLLINGTVGDAGITTLISLGDAVSLAKAQVKINSLSDEATKVAQQAKLDAVKTLNTAKADANARVTALTYTSQADKAKVLNEIAKATTVEAIEAIIVAAEKADWKIADAPVKALIEAYVKGGDFDNAKKELAKIKDPETKAEVEKLIAAAESTLPVFSGVAHVQNIGDKAGTLANEALFLGTKGKGLRLESISLSLAGVTGLSYRVHVQNRGWLDAVTDGKEAGTHGKGLRLEAIEISLTGDLAAKYDVYYRVHVQNQGDQAWKLNGQTAGTSGKALRLEALQVVVVPKGAGAPSIAFVQ